MCWFGCEHGYKLVGNETTQCIKNFPDETVGKWTGKPPICQGKSNILSLDSYHFTKLGCFQEIKCTLNESRKNKFFSHWITPCEFCSRE